MNLTTEQILQKGIEAHQAGQFNEANHLYSSIIRSEPDHPDANHNLGVLMFGFGEKQDSLPFFKTALKSNPNVAQYWLSYIDALLQLDKKNEAKNLLNEAKKNNFKGDGFDNLEKKLNTSEFNHEMNEPTQVQLEVVINLYNQGLLEQVLDKTSELLKNFPNSATLYNLQGAANNGLMQYDAAIQSFEKAINIKSDFSDALNNLGISLQEKGRLKEAIVAFKKALSINPSYADAYYNMGIALQKDGELIEVIEAFNQAIQVKPNFPEAHNNLGIALQEQGKLEEATRAFNTAVSINNEYSEAYYNLGDAFKEQGIIEQAIQAYNQALTIKPNYAEAKHMLSALTGKSTTEAPREYIENLFDKHAKNFDHSLVDKLDYKTPKILLGIAKKMHGNNTLGSVLDLGCGTGLLGSEARGFCERLEGIDLSQAMLEQATFKNIYDKLTHIEINEYLSNANLDFDYFFSADVFIYLGDLAQVFQLIKSRNKRPGKLAFSTEHTEKTGFCLESSGRYSHSKKYIEDLCKKYDYSIAHFSKTDLRKEKGTYLTGGLYLLNF